MIETNLKIFYKITSQSEPAKNPIIDAIDDIPPGVMGFIGIPIAIGAVYLPKLVSSLMDGDLSPEERALIAKIGGAEGSNAGMKMYSKEEPPPSPPPPPFNYIPENSSQQQQQQQQQ